MYKSSIVFRLVAIFCWLRASVRKSEQWRVTSWCDSPLWCLLQQHRTAKNIYFYNRDNSQIHQIFARAFTQLCSSTWGVDFALVPRFKVLISGIGNTVTTCQAKLLCPPRQVFNACTKSVSSLFDYFTTRYRASIWHIQWRIWMTYCRYPIIMIHHYSFAVRLFYSSEFYYYLAINPFWNVSFSAYVPRRLPTRRELV